jgi:hypothetical protein
MLNGKYVVNNIPDPGNTKFKFGDTLIFKSGKMVSWKRRNGDIGPVVAAGTYYDLDDFHKCYCTSGSRLTPMSQDYFMSEWGYDDEH